MIKSEKKLSMATKKNIRKAHGSALSKFGNNEKKRSYRCKNRCS